MKRYWLLGALIVSACDIGAVPPGKLPAALRPPAGALRVVAREYGKVAGVQYQLKEPYPAEAEVSRIEARIPTEWTPRSEDFLNPGVPTQSRGWQRYFDSVRSPKVWVHRWSGEWQTARGDIISYDLYYRTPGEYRYPIERPGGDLLEVTASLFPVEVVQEMQTQAKRAMARRQSPAGSQ